MLDMGGHPFGMNYEHTSEQRGNYSNDVWGAIPENSHSSPSPVYNQNYLFMNHGLPNEFTYTSMPPPLAQQHRQQMLRPLLPAPTCISNIPSMLANPISPKSARLKARSTSGPAPRKTLNDDDRRRMCQIHEDNPGVKQAEIGSLFGVERSTVSKVLRYKEKFLSLEEPSASPPKQPKVPDFERTLKNWWCKERDRGCVRNRAEIRKEAIKFATFLGSQEYLQMANDDQWLDSLKEKTKKNRRTARKKSSRRASVNTAQAPGPIDFDNVTLTTSPICPTQDDVRLALETILRFIDQAPQEFVEDAEHQTILNLTARMR
ncbi:hypothetical protein ACLOAV_008323 [Pseudogymnoascus australis]